MTILNHKTTLAALALAALSLAGCHGGKPAPKRTPAPAQTAPAPAPAQPIAAAPAPAAAPAFPKRRVIVDESGTAYEVLEEHERLCQNCDR